MRRVCSFGHQPKIFKIGPRQKKLPQLCLAKNQLQFPKLLFQNYGESKKATISKSTQLM